MVTQEQLRELVARTRRAQGLPARVSNPIVLRRIACLLASPPSKPSNGGSKGAAS